MARLSAAVENNAAARRIEDVRFIALNPNSFHAKAGKMPALPRGGLPKFMMSLSANRSMSWTGP